MSEITATLETSTSDPNTFEPDGELNQLHTELKKGIAYYVSLAFVFPQ